MIYRVLNYNAFESGELNEIFSRLTAAQKNYIKSKNERSALQSLAARALLCRVLKDFCGEDFAEHIASDEKGRLYIEGRSDIFVSISHSKDMVAAAVAKRRVGIDIECIRTVSERLQKRVCKQTFETPEDFFRHWTLKEAWLKASGITFSEMLSLDAMDISQYAKIVSYIQDGHYITVLEIE